MRAALSTLGLVASVLALTAIVGCPPPSGSPSPNDPNTFDPNDPNDPNATDAAPALAGNWSATIGCLITQSLSGTPSTPRNDDRTLEVRFDTAGRLLAVTIVGFAGADEALASLSERGDADSLDVSAGSIDATVNVTLRGIFYTANSAHIVIDIEYSGMSGSLVQSGTATQIVDVSTNNATLNYDVFVDYAVDQIAGTITLETGETSECTGQLSKAP